MADTVLIMAAGESARFGQAPLKQLVEVNGETLIARQVRMVRERGHEPTVVTWHELIREAVDCLVYKPRGHRWLIESILSAALLWQGTVAVLLGDVWFTDDALDRVLACDRPICLFGDSGEIFAMTFADHELARGYFTELNDIGHGRLWNLFRLMHGYPLHDYVCPDGHDPAFVWITDDTQDVDYPSEYDELLRKVEGVPA
jgi:hypothetical protein